MKKFSKKLISEKLEEKTVRCNCVEIVKSKAAGQFNGIASRAVRVTPVIIPGYRIIG